MFEPDKDGGTEKKQSGYSGPSGYSGETDRATGEYRYKNGYTQKIYSDAHYVPVEDTTVPPNYYDPTEKNRQEPKVKQAKVKYSDVDRGKKAAKIAGIIALCIVCAIGGGLLGSWITRDAIMDRINNLESELGTIQETTDELHNIVIGEESMEDEAALPMVASEESSIELSPSDIYTSACEQVVGITTEVTYTNFFGMTSSSAVSGTGFFITEDGYILTNFHVIEYAYLHNCSVQVITHDGTRLEAAIIGVEESNDIAVLKVECSGANAAQIGDSSELRVGESVFAIGNPLGELDFTMTCGHISALDRAISTDTNQDAINMFQFDAAVNSGNSGGPVYDEYGMVIGVVTAKYRESGVEGIGFAIPVNDAANIANDIITVGYVTGKPSLGVKFDQRYSSIYSQYYGLPQGAYVASVDTGSCAEDAGIAPGDIITAIGVYQISSFSEARSALKHYAAGEEIHITYYHSGDVIETDLALDEDIPETGTKAYQKASYYAAG